MDLITKMVEHHVWLTGEMVARAARLDDHVLDKPIEISVEGVDDDPTLGRSCPGSSGRWACGTPRWRVANTIGPWRSTRRSSR